MLRIKMRLYVSYRNKDARYSKKLLMRTLKIYWFLHLYRIHGCAVV